VPVIHQARGRHETESLHALKFLPQFRVPSHESAVEARGICRKACFSMLLDSEVSGPYSLASMHGKQAVRTCATVIGRPYELIIPIHKFSPARESGKPTDL